LKKKLNIFLQGGGCGSGESGGGGGGNDDGGSGSGGGDGGGEIGVGSGRGGGGEDGGLGRAMSELDQRDGSVGVGGADEGGGTGSGSGNFKLLFIRFMSIFANDTAILIITRINKAVNARIMTNTVVTIGTVVEVVVFVRLTFTTMIAAIKPSNIDIASTIAKIANTSITFIKNFDLEGLADEIGSGGGGGSACGGVGNASRIDLVPRDEAGDGSGGGEFLDRFGNLNEGHEHFENLNNFRPLEHLAHLGNRQILDFIEFSTTTGGLSERAGLGGGL
jgi:hypothetical protein